MATRQEDIARSASGSPGFDAGRITRAGFSRTLTWFDALMPGGSTPRQYRREGYPEVEFYQVMAGRKDRFHRN